MAGLFLQKQYLSALSYYKVSQNVEPLTKHKYEYCRTDRWEAGSLWISLYRG